MTATDRTDAGQALFVAKAAAIVFAGTVGGYVFGFVFYLLVARLFGKAQFGEYILSLNLSRILVAVCLLGFEVTILRYVARYHGAGDSERVRGVMRVALRVAVPCLFLGAAGLAILARPLAESVFNQASMAALLYACAAAVPFLGLTLLFAAGLKALCLPAYAIVCQDFGDWTLRLLLSVVLIGLGCGFTGVMIGHVGAAILLCGLALYFYLTHFWSRFPGATARLSPWPLLAFGVPQILIHLVHLLVKSTDLFLLGHFKGTETTGVYGAAAQLALVGMIFLACFSVIISPMVSDFHARGEIGKVGRLLKLTTKWAIVFAFPYFVLLIMFSARVLGLYGPGFEDGASSLTLLCVAQLLDTCCGLVFFVLIMSGHQMIELCNSVALCLGNVALNMILIPEYGMVGAALATCTAVVSVAVIRALQVYYFLRVHSFSLEMLKPLAAAAAAGLIVMLFLRFMPAESVAGLGGTVACGLVFLVVYVLGILAAGLSPEDRDVLRAVRGRLSPRTPPSEH